MPQQQPLISVVVPVYKAEATLDACVGSILAQTLDDFELLLVDDESPDGSPALCDAWAARDPRIRALHPKKAGPGPSGARNAGLDAARGAWITMVDSDDTVAPDLLATLYTAAQRSGADLVICNSCQRFPRRQLPGPAGRTAFQHRYPAGRGCLLGCLQYPLDQPVHRHGSPALRRQTV